MAVLMRMKRPVIGLLIAALVAAAVALASDGSDRSQPRLRVVVTTPLKVRGTGFYAREGVRITARANGRARVRRLVADARGGFTASFGALPVDPCNGFAVIAVGARGDRAVAKLPMRECAPRL